jgi:hypothetical protein
VLAAGILVIPSVLDADSNIMPGEPFIHRGIVTGLFADAPERAQVLMIVGSFTAFMVCVWCRLCGVTKGRTRRYTGYAGPVEALHGPGSSEFGGPAKALQMGVDHDQGERCLVALAWRCGSRDGVALTDSLGGAWRLVISWGMAVCQTRQRAIESSATSLIQHLSRHGNASINVPATA